jgi:hypothetical protein
MVRVGAGWHLDTLKHISLTAKKLKEIEPFVPILEDFTPQTPHLPTLARSRQEPFTK